MQTVSFFLGKKKEDYQFAESAHSVLSVNS